MNCQNHQLNQITVDGKSYTVLTTWKIENVTDLAVSYWLCLDEIANACNVNEENGSNWISPKSVAEKWISQMKRPTYLGSLWRHFSNFDNERDFISQLAFRSSPYSLPMFYTSMEKYCDFTFPDPFPTRGWILHEARTIGDDLQKFILQTLYMELSRFGRPDYMLNEFRLIIEEKPRFEGARQPYKIKDGSASKYQNRY